MGFFASRAILGSGLGLALLLLHEYDLREIFINCAQCLLFLLSAHTSFIAVSKSRAKMDWEKKDYVNYWLCLGLLVFHYQGLPFVTINLPKFCMQWAITIGCYFMAKYLKISRNAHENELLLKSTKYHIGPGLAQANYRFLENVIKGKKGGGGDVEKMKKQYKEQEELNEDEQCWFCPKVLILFPEWRKGNRERIWGSVGDIFKKEKENGSNHKLSVEKITYGFKASGGNERRCELEVLKNQDEEGNWYAIFAENRPLNTLYRMVGEPVIPFSEEDFNQQFHIYMKELRKLLDADEGCRGKYEIFHYKDPGSDGRFNFSKEIIKQMRSIRNENAGGPYSTVHVPTRPSEDAKDKIETDSSTDMETALKEMHANNDELNEKDKNV